MNRMSHENDPVTEEELIALHLQQLEPAREWAVRLSLTESATLRAQSENIAATLNGVRGLPLHVDRAVLDRNWKALESRLVPFPAPLPVFPRWRMPAFAGLALAGMATAAFVAWWPGAPTPAAAVTMVPGTRAALTMPAARLDRQPEAPRLEGAAPKPDGLTRQPTGSWTGLRVSHGVFHPQVRSVTSGSRPLALTQTPVPPWTGAGRPAAAVANVPDQAVQAEPGPAQAEVAGIAALPGGGAGGLSAQTHAAHLAAAKRPARLETTLALGIAGQFTVSKDGQGPFGTETQSLTKSPVYLASLRQSFRPWLGYTLTVGGTSLVEDNSIPTTQPYRSVSQNVYEGSLAYTVQKHVKTRVRLSASLGAGALLFRPKAAAAGVESKLYRPLGVATLGVEYRVSRHLGVRAEYRLLTYRFPDYGAEVGRRTTLTSEPTLAVVYRFGGEK